MNTPTHPVSIRPRIRKLVPLLALTLAMVLLSIGDRQDSAGSHGPESRSDRKLIQLK